jgi:transcription elongation factor Elf1
MTLGKYVVSVVRGPAIGIQKKVNGKLEPVFFGQVTGKGLRSVDMSVPVADNEPNAECENCEAPFHKIESRIKPISPYREYLMDLCEPCHEQEVCDHLEDEGMDFGDRKCSNCGKEYGRD